MPEKAQVRARALVEEEARPVEEEERLQEKLCMGQLQRGLNRVDFGTNENYGFGRENGRGSGGEEH